ncbi:sulfurtransferase TusA family protein [Kordiimonas lipolytica]|uniref:Sulfurtransferase TusA family protein n=1 Tax=Kordiimonas lipolytica TaxID=1662421 RepID=A0ABV8UCV8_9PROT|nr:sulfurtransferase TusA family protein [Kordiimonas lipolytica]
MQRHNLTDFLDLRGATCPMAFVKTKLHLDQVSPGGTTTVVFEQSPGNEPLIRSICSLGHTILSEKTIEASFLTDDDAVTDIPPPSDDVQLTILEIEVKR